MAFGTERRTAPTRVVERAVIDEGLRAYMLSVYNYMASGLALTGIVAYITANASVVMNEAGQIIALTSLGATLFHFRNTSSARWLRVNS